MQRRLFLLMACCALSFSTSTMAAPKLIVVISIDQFRYDYLERFEQHFGEGGFNYLVRNGANFVNATFKHSKTSTGPGHAVLLSGAYPNTHGIIANDWFDRSRNTQVYCFEDPGVEVVGGKGERRSPRTMIGSTFGDELRLATSFRSKVISISNKDRAAIPMGGKMPTGVFWMSESLFVTSSYYMHTLPSWADRFNRSGLVNSFFGKTWTKKLPEAAYAGLDDDDVPYESGYNGLGKAFPHRVTGNDRSKITPSYYRALQASPFSAEILHELAKQAVIGEELGTRGVTDLLCVSFSATDEVGHVFGPHSHEVMDMVVRMDGILAEFFAFLDKQVTLADCIIVLTADHGVAPIPDYLKKKQPTFHGGWTSWERIAQACTSVLNNRLGPPPLGRTWVRHIVANNVYLDENAIATKTGLTLHQAARLVADTLRSLPEIAAALSAEELAQPLTANPLHNKLRRSFYRPRSGDVVYALQPYWVTGKTGDGAKHGEPYDYDAHVPLILSGRGIRKGRFFQDVSPVDLAPTLSALLGIAFPAGREGRVLHEALE